MREVEEVGDEEAKVEDAGKGRKLRILKQSREVCGRKVQARAFLETPAFPNGGWLRVSVQWRRTAQQVEGALEGAGKARGQKCRGRYTFTVLQVLLDAVFFTFQPVEMIAHPRQPFVCFLSVFCTLLHPMQPLVLVLNFVEHTLLAPELKHWAQANDSSDDRPR